MSDKSLASSVEAQQQLIEELGSTVAAQQKLIEELSSSAQAQQKLMEELVQKVTLLTNPPKKSQKEMTDEHARRVLTGDLAGLSHGKAADALDLSYGQVYSCRLDHTFRHISKEVFTDKGVKNPWKS